MPIRDAIDALAEAIRRDALGHVRPLWADADHSTRSLWLRRARKVIEALAECGFVFRSDAAAPDAIATERAECAKLVGWLGRKARVDGMTAPTNPLICLGQPPIAGCGRVLTDEERHYYTGICEDCTRKWDQAIDDWKRGGANEELDKLYGAPAPVRH